MMLSPTVCARIPTPVTPSQDLDSPSSADTTLCIDSEDVLSGYGDISHSEINFVPTGDDQKSESVPVSIQHDPSHRRNAKRPQPPTTSHRRTMMRKLAVKATFEEFTALVDSLRGSRDRAEAAHVPKPSLKAELVAKLGLPHPTVKKSKKRSPSTTTPVNTEAERYNISHPMPLMKRVRAPLHLEDSLYDDFGVRIPPCTPPNTFASASPKTKGPWRGDNPLPQRPPLPRWDLHDPDVSLEGKQYKVKVKA